MSTFESQMRVALDMAKESLDAGDHPYGSVIVTASGELPERNRVVTTSDPSAHSELMAIRSAAALWGLESTVGATLLTSYEPCPMCFGAILNAGIGRLVIAARRTVGEAPLGDYTVEKLLELTAGGFQIEIAEGVCANEAADFYRDVS